MKAHHLHHHAHHLHHLAAHRTGAIEQLVTAFQHPNAHPQLCFYSGMAAFIILLLLFYSPLLGLLLNLLNPGQRGSLDRVGGSGETADVAFPMLVKIGLGGAAVACAYFLISTALGHVIPGLPS